jgi:hypothetical protein
MEEKNVAGIEGRTRGREGKKKAKRMQDVLIVFSEQKQKQKRKGRLHSTCLDPTDGHFCFSTSPTSLKSPHAWQEQGADRDAASKNVKSESDSFIATSIATATTTASHYHPILPHITTIRLLGSYTTSMITRF